MDVPETVATALADRPVEGAVCLEAGAGVGNATAGLLEAGAERVYAVSNDPADPPAVRERVGPDSRLVPLVADLRATPRADDSVDLITAHGLCNVLEPAALDTVVSEFGRVAAPGAHLVVDDYDPLPEEAAVRELFAVENAAAQLAEDRAALTFYPASMLRRSFEGAGWRFDRERTLLDPVPWTESHVAAHADVARSLAADAPAELRGPLQTEIDDCEERVGSESAGRMYSLAFRWPGEK